MKMIFLSIGFLAGVVFATKYPYMADTISVWVQTNPFLTGLMRRQYSIGWSRNWCEQCSSPRCAAG